VSLRGVGRRSNLAEFSSSSLRSQRRAHGTALHCRETSVTPHKDKETHRYETALWDLEFGTWTCFLVFLACSGLGSRTNYYPLTTGDVWTYELFDVTQTDTSAPETVKTGIIRYEVKGRIGLPRRRDIGMHAQHEVPAARHRPGAKARGDTAFTVDYSEYLRRHPRPFSSIMTGT